MDVVTVADNLGLAVNDCGLLFGLAGLICGSFASWIFFIDVT